MNIQVGCRILNTHMSYQIHYNSEDADLFTYLEDPTVFNVREGYIQAPSGEWPVCCSNSGVSDEILNCIGLFSSQRP